MSKICPVKTAKTTAVPNYFTQFTSALRISCWIARRAVLLRQLYFETITIGLKPIPGLPVTIFLCVKAINICDVKISTAHMSSHFEKAHKSYNHSLTIE
jgi:hypothetical protein